VIDAVVESARRALLAPVAVVTGHGASDLSARLEAHDILAVHDANWQLGRVSTLATGIRALRRAADPEAVVVLLGDEPGVTATVIGKIVAAWSERGADMVRARYQDRAGHPVLLSARSWSEVEKLDGADGSIWEQLSSAGFIAEEVRIDDDAPIDVDDPAALAAARARLAEPESLPQDTSKRDGS
jgi:CTP:molybdopterin cytidylyltransferase MocA